MKHSVYGVDVAKRVFQVHCVDMETGEITSKQIKRAGFLEHFVNRAPCLIGMEACGGAQHWARRLMEMGHQVKLMPGKAVKAFVHGNKNDVADARAIWMAVQQPGVKAVAVKTEAQQAVLALHRMRQQLVKFRTMQSNGLRGLLTEYGEVMAVGRAALDRAMSDVLARLSDRLPAVLIDTLREQWGMLEKLDQQIAAIEQRLSAWLKQDKACKTIAEIPGVGLLTATAAVATMGDAKAFKSGREFAAWLGLAPGQTGTGGRVRLLGISKRGDTYLRTLLIHGARAVLTHAKEPSAWVQEISKRRPPNVVTVALANKMARTIWALLAHDRQYERSYVSVKPA
ncbi:IS110 family transposase [Noviherbaspirillum sedimenti]|uniref:IS110 family transposase n=1 Tax=Noviherbaspirillum sedimenti TaxID=2320865 RepID=A0A3A3GJ28_9BURK|nr:IS110 family transposase [Noviherbaspirillum sedimenti]RJG02296.1 IS110 family transposase [Noviherbaspirillum sedimenti]